MKKLLAIASASFFALTIFGCKGAEEPAVTTATPGAATAPTTSPENKSGGATPGQAPAATLAPNATDKQWSAGTNNTAAGK